MTVILSTCIFISFPSYASQEQDNLSGSNESSLKYKYTLQPSFGKFSFQHLRDLQTQKKLTKKTQSSRSFKSTSLVSFPDQVDLRATLPEPYDQGTLGSCTANAIAGAIQADLLKRKICDLNNLIMPSRLGIYYHERYLENRVNSDKGACLSDGALALTLWGFHPETFQPYDDKSSAFTKQPSPKCYAWANINTCVGKVVCKPIKQDLTTFKKILSKGTPIVFGFNIYPSFETPKVDTTGYVDKPSPEEKPIGGHAVLMVGYDDREKILGQDGILISNPNYKRFIIRNSWGTKWGDKGHFTLPYDFVTDPTMAFDFYTIKNTTPDIPVEQQI
jgi:C1A family cysteine protease